MSKDRTQLKKRSTLAKHGNFNCSDPQDGTLVWNGIRDTCTDLAVFSSGKGFNPEGYLAFSKSNIVIFHRPKTNKKTIMKDNFFIKCILLKLPLM